jgi:hypothetical protein
LLELKELAENREYIRLGRNQELANEKNQNRRLIELNVNMLYNHRYLEVKERYLINLNALRVYYNHGG